jgi:hypothetical protein
MNLNFSTLNYTTNISAIRGNTLALRIWNIPRKTGEPFNFAWALRDFATPDPKTGDISQSDIGSLASNSTTSHELFINLPSSNYNIGDKFTFAFQLEDSDTSRTTEGSQVTITIDSDSVENTGQSLANEIDPTDLIRSTVSSGVIETNVGAGSAVQSGFFGLDGEFGISRLVSKKGDKVLQIVNDGSEDIEFWINGQNRAKINKTGVATDSNDLTTKDYVDNSFYPPTLIPTLAHIFNGTAVTSTSATANQAWYVLADITVPCTVDAVLLQNGVSIAGDIKVGLYKIADADKNNNDNPLANSTLIASSDPVAQTGALQTITFTEPVNLTPGKYFIAWMASSSSATYNRHANANVMNGIAYISNEGTFTLPSTAPAGTMTGSFVPGLRLRTVTKY